MQTIKPWLFALLLAWTHRVSTTPVPLSISTPSDNPGYGPIPKELRVERDFVLPLRQYTEESVFINIVQALRQIAPGDFNAEIPVASYRTIKYMQPMINIQASHGTIIMRKYVVWGLYFAFLVMYHDLGGFFLSHFTLSWNNAEVGGIGIGDLQAMQDALDRQGKGRTIMNSGTASINQDINTLNITTSSLTTTNNNGDDSPSNGVTVTCKFLDKVIPKVDLSIAIVWFLAMVAHTPAETRIQGRYIAPASAGGVHLVVQALERTRPPFLTYATVIETLSAAANYLVFKDKYQGLEMVINVGNDAVGKAMMTQPWSSS
ncbi:MAG: hypothetical protein Q9222_005676 [Ikaeria aurantiellina]